MRLASADGQALGTTVRVVVTDARALGVACRLLDAELRRIDRACSRFRGDSELNSLDRAGGVPVVISETLARAVAVALRGARLTGGLVDPTVGAAMTAAGYDRDFAAMPRAGGTVTLVRRPAPGWTQLEFDAGTRTLRIPAGVRLDLGATAKALAADEAAAAIAADTGVGVLVSLGGDIAVAGPAPADGWPVRVQDVTGHPDEPDDDDAQRVVLRAGGLATSSTTARRWTRGGQVMHHIMDPRSGGPAASPWRTVSVTAASCVDANIASTASIIAGADAVGWLGAAGLDARLVTHAGEVQVVGNWPAQRRI